MKRASMPRAVLYMDNWEGWKSWKIRTSSPLQLNKYQHICDKSLLKYSDYEKNYFSFSKLVPMSTPFSTAANYFGSSSVRCSAVGLLKNCPVVPHRRFCSFHSQTMYILQTYCILQAYVTMFWPMIIISELLSLLLFNGRMEERMELAFCYLN